MKRVLIGLTILLATILVLATPSSTVQAQDPNGDQEQRPPYQEGPPTVPSKESLLQGAIVGGQDADPGEWPWQARVRPGPFLCGGALIHVDWVLTAAHCITDNSGGVIAPGTVTVILGDHNKAISEASEQTINVSNIFRHPSYNPANQDNDVALLQLSVPANIVPGQVETIPLNDNDALSAGTLATVTGWGTTSFGGSTPDILQEVNVPIVSNQTCNASYGSITANMVCAGYQAGGKDSCQGDSGGPLVIPDGGGGWKHIGVVSWGNGCAFENFYGVYARTSKFVPWIEGFTGSLTVPPPPPPPSGDLIADGDFEDFTGDWLEYSSNGYILILDWANLIGIPAASGANYGWFGGADNEFSEISQVVTIPAGGTATLTFSYQISSEDVCGYDFANVIANGMLLASYDLCQDTTTTGWVEETIDMSSFSGQTVTLSFNAVTDSIYMSSFFVDLVSLIHTTDTPPPPPPPGTGPVPNGNFELGNNGDWTESSSNDFDLILPNTFGLPVPPHAGSYLAWLGGLNNEISVLSQNVTVPNSNSATLVFYYQVLSEDFCGYDFTDVTLDGQLLESYELCAETTTAEWQQATFDVSNLAGQTVPLEFYTETDVSFVSSFFIDDVTLEGSSPPPPPPPEEDDFVLTAESGSGNIELNWTVTTNPNVETYRVNRRAEGQSQTDDFTAIDTTPETTYYDEDNTLEEGKEYSYRIEALDGNDTVVATSNVASAVFGQLVLKIPQIVAEQGQEAIIPINIGNADGLRIAATDIWLDYDHDVVNPVRVETTALTTGYTWEFTGTPEVIDPVENIRRVKIAAIGSPPPEIFGDGSLFWLIFEAVGSDDERTTLNLRGQQEGLPPGSGGTNIFDLISDAPFETVEVDLQLIDGRLTVQNPPEAEFILGDVNGDTNIGAIDAATAMAIAVHKLNPSVAQIAAGDINGNGVVQAADAAMILYRAVNPDWPPLPTQSAAELAATQGQQITLKLDDITGVSGQSVQTTLRAIDLQDFAGGDFTIVYDPTLIESFTGVEKAGLASNFQLFDFYDDGNGRLYISMANDQTISGSGPLATLTVKLASNAATLLAQGASSARMHLADADVSNQNGLDFETNFANNQIILLSATVTVTDGSLIYLPLIVK